jgi:hypothetical protein
VTASELAFMGLGLLFGAAAGAALLVVLGTRAPRREIRVTVTRDALPRRSETLSQDAFMTSSAEPAPGGPADRRRLDRAESRPDHGDHGAGPDGTGGVPFPRTQAPFGRPLIQPSDRTLVPSGGPSVGVAIYPEVDRELDDLRRTATSPARRDAALERILRGEHMAMVEVVDRLAGEDSLRRREWEVLLSGLVEAMTEIAVEESVIDFPMGTAFWDTFTVEQCRRIVATLATMGYRYDGRTGWVGRHVPAYRDLTNAMAEVGFEPRRIRAWPNQTEIGDLFLGARPAPEELLAAAGPNYTAEDMQDLLGERALGLADLWMAWAVVRPVLFDDEPPADLPIEP